jgi:hypothetical protein
MRTAEMTGLNLLQWDGSVSLGNYSIVDDDPDHEPQMLPYISISEGDFYVVEAIDSEDECMANQFMRVI